MVAKVNHTVNIFLDDLGSWNKVSKPEHWRQSHYIVPAFVDQGSVRRPAPVFSNLSGWGVTEIYSGANKSKVEIGSLTKEAFKSLEIKAKEKYEQDQGKLKSLLKLDRDSLKKLEYFFRPHDRSPQESIVPELICFSAKDDGMKMSLSWAEQAPLLPWLTWGRTSVLLKSVDDFVSHERWIHLEENIVGMRFSFWTSGHLDTTINFIFVDDSDRYFVKTIPLDHEGYFTTSFGFDSSGLEILTVGGRRHKNQSAPQKLKLSRVEIRHAPTKAKHGGLQHLKLFPLEWIKKR
jgi:hypothetical protein